MLASDPRLSVVVVTCVVGAESWVDGTSVIECKKVYGNEQHRDGMYVAGFP